MKMAIVPLRRGHGLASSMEVLAAQTLKIASINGLGDTEKIETELEDEIRWEESRSPPKEIIGRLQRKCEEVVHSKQVLLLVIILNVLDCLLIMSEMTLEFYHVSSLYFDRQETEDEFLKKMKEQYPVALQDTKITAVNVLNRIVAGFVLWISSSHSIAYFRNDCANFLNATSAFSFNLSSEANSTTDRPEELGVSLLDQVLNGTRNSNFYDNSSLIKELSTFNDAVKIIHSLHYGSISILSVLVAETLVKILCTGRRFFKKKMEVFDAVIILISFTLDLIFVEGLTNFEVPNFIIILSLLLPWRILRVLNSLIVAVMDQQRFHMKAALQTETKGHQATF
ncbi:uncharacterized protein LOC112565758 isoform X2 [Pomacea canaliculata]|uniref:uncharacterized protein LOC112565758 isoform X2 n=1 Tax=Pomacea canaliculata TaxID=400727 RepID=UPI000D735642|nr:uncharacterized protein LOC112565758 isoform X2 [Pomacea canaliculata]